MFTAIFLGCMAVSAVIVAFGVISDSTGADMPGYSQPAATTPPPPPVVADPVVLSTEKRNLTPNGETIIGLKDPSITINATGALTTTTFDTTTYGDRAIIKLTNATGSSIDLTGMCIKGKPVMQLAGQNGYVWEYSDYDAIEKEGEQFVEVSNDFIFDPVQAKQIGDFVWKELKPHKLYSLVLVGCQYQYEIGDVYHLTLTHTMNGGTMENIDTDVEVMGVSINRSVGGVGMTNLNLRVPSEAWALTLAKNSKLVGAGNAQRLNNRSNVVTVASSTWTGQADYFCDGTADDIEIQAAIDYLHSVGGGSLYLTSGIFNISEVGTTSFAGTTVGYGCVIESNILISGSGESTEIVFYYETNQSFCFYCNDSTSNINISSLSARNYQSNVNAQFVWSSLCDSTGLYNIKTDNYLVLNHGSRANFTTNGGACNITACNAYGIRGSKLNMSACYCSFLRVYGYSNISACTMADGPEYGLFIDYSYNTITGCNISSDLVGAYFNFGSSSNILTSCKVSTISDNGTSNMKANNV